MSPQTTTVAPARLTRISVQWESQRIDVGVPGGVPVAELLPSLTRRLRVLDNVSASFGFRLVRTDGTAPADVQRARVRAVRQRDTILQLDLDPEGTVTFQTAEPTASVMVRDRKGTMEYAD